MFDMFVGGAVQRMSIFALGVMPYISASIIMSLLTHVNPYSYSIKKRRRRDREDKKLINIQDTALFY